ncbi:MAG: DUF2281 domain-containing protein [Chitinophagales bacterium]
MNVNTQEIIDKYNQLSPKLQQEVLNYIDFLMHKYGVNIPESKEREEETTSNEVQTISVEEDLKLDKEIAGIEEKKKDKIAPDWHEIKQAFKDEFY